MKTPCLIFASLSLENFLPRYIIAGLVDIKFGAKSTSLDVDSSQISSSYLSSDSRENESGSSRMGSPSPWGTGCIANGIFK